jgi:hypothetical protein
MESLPDKDLLTHVEPLDGDTVLVPTVTQMVPKPSGRQFYGKTNAQHGVHMPPPKPAAYTCEDCLDLERRVRSTFKEMGFEF